MTGDVNVNRHIRRRRVIHPPEERERFARAIEKAHAKAFGEVVREMSLSRQELMVELSEVENMPTAQLAHMLGVHNDTAVVIQDALQRAILTKGLI